MKSTPRGGLNSKKAKNKVVDVVAEVHNLCPYLSFRLLGTTLTYPSCNTDRGV